jgi:hypothetical protein
MMAKVKTRVKPKTGTALRATKVDTGSMPTLAVIALTLGLLFWLRQDALDIYWQQTRHGELGLTHLSDAELWHSGTDVTKVVSRTLNQQIGAMEETQERLMLAANVLWLGKSALIQKDEPTLAAAQKIHTTNGLMLKAHADGIAASVSTSPVAGKKTNKDSGSDAGQSQKESDKVASVSSDAQLHTAEAVTETEENRAVPLTQFASLNEDGRIVLSPSDKVLLVGDSMMQGVAPHVARALQNGNVKSLDLSRQSTGLTYPGYFDWPTTIKNTISKERISVLVVFLGANDTWDMVFGNKYERFGSEKWQSTYASRVESIVRYAHAQHIRVIWLGAPNMGRENINRGVKVLNQLFSAAIKDSASRYLSTRELLSDNAETYQKAITREDGKSVTVRNEDGIHFTRAGQKILSDLILRQFALPTVSKPL